MFVKYCAIAGTCTEETAIALPHKSVAAIRMTAVFFAESACAGCTVPQGAHFSLMAHRIYDLAQHVPIRFGECFKAIADVGDVGFFTKQKESIVVNGRFLAGLFGLDLFFRFFCARRKAPDSERSS